MYTIQVCDLHDANPTETKASGSVVWSFDLTSAQVVLRIFKNTRILHLFISFLEPALNKLGDWVVYGNLTECTVHKNLFFTAVWEGLREQTQLQLKRT